ncbi:MAG: amidohydrolase family protein [Phycisphaerales bacterium]|nr:amidohydrolase family protein [Phycisphaerales bacterium]
MSDAPRSPANRLGIDYRHPPARRWSGPIVDAHCHITNCAPLSTFFEAADLYGMSRFVTMSPLPDVEPLRRTYGDRLIFNAVPSFRDLRATDEFRGEWMRDLTTFRSLGAPLCKFWMAPRMRGEHGVTVDGAWARPVVDHALDLGFEFMIHVSDPVEWFAPGARYADAARYGTRDAQYDQLEWLLEYARPRRVIAAHMAGSVHDPDFIAELMRRHDNLWIDTSATKWIARGVALAPDRVCELIIRHADRVLFGSDLVVRAQFTDFDHYASRYWAHQMMWESDYRGESPIDDPDGPQPPRLAGLTLPQETLRQIYVDNARRWGFID